MISVWYAMSTAIQAAASCFEGNKDRRRLALGMDCRRGRSDNTFGTIVVANNRSCFTDENQQETVAHERNGPIENRWIGLRIDDPPADLAGLALAFGVRSKGPVGKASDLPAALERGLKAVEAGDPYLIDVLIDPSRGASFDWLADA